MSALYLSVPSYILCLSKSPLPWTGGTSVWLLFYVSQRLRVRFCRSRSGITSQRQQPLGRIFQTRTLFILLGRLQYLHRFRTRRLLKLPLIFRTLCCTFLAGYHVIVFALHHPQNPQMFQVFSFIFMHRYPKPIIGSKGLSWD